MAETDKPADKAADKPADKAEAKTIIDVAHPGKSAPSGNSKSVIVNNRPILKDPMVVTDNAAEMPDKEPSKNQPAKTKSPNIDTPQPAETPTPETEKPDETAKPDAAAEPAEPEDKLKAKPEKVVKPASEAAPADEPDAKQPAATNEDAAAKTDDKPEDKEKDDQAPAKGSPEQLEAEAAAVAKHQEAIEKLADSKQYYLPINTVEKRKAKRFVALGILLAVILVAAWADIALDAGLIKIHGLKPLTHFFSS